MSNIKIGVSIIVVVAVMYAAVLFSNAVAIQSGNVSKRTNNVNQQLESILLDTN
jgi:hypothetical protein